MKLASDRVDWLRAGGIALLAHMAGFAALALIGEVPAQKIVEEPIVLIELPPEPASFSAAAPASEPTEQAEPQLEPVTAPAHFQPPRINAPQIRAPLPREFVSTPPKIMAPTQRVATEMRPISTPSVPSAPSQQALAPSTAADGTADAKGDDPEAKREEANYYSLLSAHLNRKKRYPREAKKAREQGIVTVRFTVHSNGQISDASIRKSSGHELLDQATLDLMGRVAPLPKFPESMTRASVTISLPIDYSLRTQ
ncbi:energy transducer TonB [Qipengyuania sp.]|uniref:energy transducer TonB n=1 Tax=Qipengyuania sp. TaxID=2004515 RepID=UPI0035C7C0EE